MASMSSRAWFARSAAACLALSLFGCEFGRDRPTIAVPGDLDVTSDPSGAQIILDNRNTGLQTPATLSTSAGNHFLALDLLTSSELFVWRGNVAVPETATAFVDAALVGGCFANCPFQVSANRVECVIVGLGDFCSTFFNPNQPQENEWPAGSGNEYVANLRVQVAARVGPEWSAFAGDTVASLVYQDTWLGRSPVSVTGGAGDHQGSFRYWADPGPFVTRPLLVGLEVAQDVVAPADSDLEDVIYFRFRITNVTADPRFQHWHPEVPATGITYTDLYAGMALDADIGGSSQPIEFSDDVGTLVRDSVAFIYDLEFAADLTAPYDTAPPLVGLVIVEAPVAAARRPFTLWTIDTDWDNLAGTGDDDYGYGYRALSAQLTATDPVQDCTGPGDDIGHCSDDPGDYRLALTAGPLTLAPGDSAVYTLALVFAEPVPGTFTSGTAIEPGLPTTAGRAIEAVADSLVARARRAAALWSQVSP